MRNQVLWRKIARIIILLSERLKIGQKKALDLYYGSKVCTLMEDKQSEYFLLSDLYILDDLMEELKVNGELLSEK